MVQFQGTRASEGELKIYLYRRVWKVPVPAPTSSSTMRTDLPMSMSECRKQVYGCGRHAPCTAVKGREIDAQSRCWSVFGNVMSRFLLLVSNSGFTASWYALVHFERMCGGLGQFSVDLLR